MRHIGSLVELLAPVGLWTVHAACGPATQAVFFPDGGKDAVDAANATAKAICGRCPVMRQCRQWALDTRPEYGTWGGLTSAELADLDPRPRRRHTGGGRRLAPCGTPAAYERHVRRGEDIDDACWANRSRKKQKKEVAA